MPEETILTEAPASAGWKDSISKDVRYNSEGADRLARFDDNDFSPVVKSYFDLESSMGSSVNIPGEDATPEQKSAFYGKIGCPEDSKGYELPKLEEGEAYNEELMGSLTQAAFDEGVSKQQFSALAEKYLEMEAAGKVAKQEADDTEYERHKEEGDRILHQLMGANYDKNIELSKRAYTEYASPDLRAILDQDKYSSLKNEPEFIKMWVKVAEKQMDDTFVKGGLPDPPDDTYVPGHVNSPEMYKNGEDEDSKKARAYFTKRGYTYG